MSQPGPVTPESVQSVSAPAAESTGPRPGIGKHSTQLYRTESSIGAMLFATPRYGNTLTLLYPRPGTFLTRLREFETHP